MKTKDEFLQDYEYQLIWYEKSCHFLHGVINIYQKRLDNNNKSIFHDVTWIMSKKFPDYKINWIKDIAYYLRISGQEIREDSPIIIAISSSNSFKPTKTHLAVLQKELRVQQEILAKNVLARNNKVLDILYDEWYNANQSINIANENLAKYNLEELLKENYV